MATTRPINFSSPDHIYAFLMTRNNRSAYLVGLIEQDREYKAWAKEQA